MKTDHSLMFLYGKCTLIALLVILSVLSCHGKHPTEPVQPTPTPIPTTTYDFQVPHEIGVYYRGVLLTPGFDTAHWDTIQIAVRNDRYPGMQSWPFDSLSMMSHEICTSSHTWWENRITLSDSTVFYYADSIWTGVYRLRIFGAYAPPGHMWGGCFGESDILWDSAYRVEIHQRLIDSVNSL
jgi:hypothetical protein